MSNNSSTKVDFNKPVQTQDGLKARILCTDLKTYPGIYPVVAAVDDRDGGETILTYTREGLYRLDGVDPQRNLVNVPECLYVLMAKRPAEHRNGYHFYYHTYNTRARAEGDQEFLREKGYTSFDIAELTIHI